MAAAAFLAMAAQLATAGTPAVNGLRRVTVRDDAGHSVALARPAQRVVALSPALAELAFAAGGGDRLVAVVGGSDHPEAARALPRIGDSSGLSVEAILASQPDLVLAWEGGNDPRALSSLQRLGLPVYYSRIGTLDGIATTLERLGTLLGSDGESAARDFRLRLRRLGPSGQGGGTAVRVFYQVWDEPLMTVNGRHWISDLVGRCGGINLFGERPELVPRPGIEAVVAAEPEAILAARPAPGGPDPLQRWRRFPGIPAVAGDFLFLVDGDAISQTTPRTLDAGEAICRHLDQVRAARVRASGCGPSGSCPGR